MSRVLEGITVVEVATWTFVPAAGAALADWGATVLKIEHPVTGDPQRSLVMAGLGEHNAPSGIAFAVENSNRGKRSIGLDISTPDGHAVLMRLVAGADVFLTNLLPAVRRKLRIDTDDVRAANPTIVYARGSGYGPRGPEADRGGYDGSAFWARGAVGAAMTALGSAWPAMQRPAQGDNPAGMVLAGGVAAALVKRARTGVGSVVDVSLLGTALWTVAYDVVAAGVYDIERVPIDWRDTPNPISGLYRTADDRFLTLVMIESDRYWAELCRRVGEPQLATDPRFVDAAARTRHSADAVAALDEVFGRRTLAEWQEVLEGVGPWDAFQNPREVHDDPQVHANGYLRPLKADDGREFAVVSNPVQFDEAPPDVERAPAHGQDTELVLMELGYEWDQIAEFKSRGVVI